MNESTVEEVKARIDLADLIASYGIAIRRAGASLKACCPFHNEKTPSFNINAAKGFYHCFGCGESGDAIKFVQKMEGLSFPEAVRKLADQCGVVITDESPDPDALRRERLLSLMASLAQFYRRCLLEAREGRLARDYLERRELTGPVGDDWLIGYAPKGAAAILKWGEKHGFTAAELEAAGVIKAPERPGDVGYHRFGGRLMFSVRDKRGRVVAFSGRELEGRKNTGKYVNSPETLIFKKSKVLFGFDRAAAAIAKHPHREAIACEGQIDCIRLHLSGFANAVASQGTAFTAEHAAMLKRVCDSMVLMYDDDSAGHKATIKVARMMLALEVPVRVVSLPDGDDPDSFLRRHGAAELSERIAAAESIVAFQCRVERGKETDPGSIDAVQRVTRALLATVAASPSAILRESMLAEAARLLALPVAALREELAKTKVERPELPVAERPEEDELSAAAAASAAAGPEAPLEGEDAAAVAPPPPLELELVEFLLAHAGDAAAVQLEALVGELLPRAVFVHDFTWRFVEAWRLASRGEAAALGAFAGALSPREREWFEGALGASGRVQAASAEPETLLEDYVRSLWIAHVRRERGRLPAAGDAAADCRRLELTTYLKRINMVKWEDVKTLLRDLQASGGVSKV